MYELIKLDPHLLLYIFIPPLLFLSGLDMNMRVFKFIKWQILSCAFLGTGLSICLTALLTKLIFFWYVPAHACPQAADRETHRGVMPKPPSCQFQGLMVAKSEDTFGKRNISRLGIQNLGEHGQGGGNPEKLDIHALVWSPPPPRPFHTDAPWEDFKGI